MLNFPTILTTILTKLPTNRNWIFWIVIILFIKSYFFLYKVSIEESNFSNIHYTETFAREGGDTLSYFEPIESVLTNGNYFEDFRMPGYGWLYWILRLFLSVAISLNTLVIIQLILSVISVYILAKISYLIFKKESYFYLTIVLYAISTFVSLYDHVLLTESFCTSSLIFSLYFLLKSKQSANYLLLAGLFLTWCIFLKPVMAPLLIWFALYILIKDGKIRLSISKYNWKQVLLFLIPFIMIDGAWIFRNYGLYKRIIPLTKSIYYTGIEGSYLGSLFQFMNSYGGSIVNWEPGSDISFFLPTPDYIKKKIKVTPPSYIYTSKFNYDSLVVVKELISNIVNPKISKDKKRKNEIEVITKLNVYTKSIKDEKPFLFYVLSRVKVLKTFFVHSGTYNLFLKASFELNTLEWLFKVFYSLLYAIVIIGGCIGSFYLIIKGFKNIDYILISSIGIYIALVFPVLLKMDEFRYFVPGYPLFLLGCVYILISVSTKIIKKYSDA